MNELTSIDQVPILAIWCVSRDIGHTSTVIVKGNQGVRRGHAHRRATASGAGVDIQRYARLRAKTLTSAPKLTTTLVAPTPKPMEVLSQDARLMIGQCVDPRHTVTLFTSL